MYRFYIRVFGCPVRGIEAERVRQYFLANHCRESSLKNAEIIGVFGCSVINATEKTTLEFLREINHPGKRIILFGCSPELSAPKIREFFSGEMLATNALEKIDTLFPEFSVKFGEISLPTISHEDLEYNKPYLQQYYKYQNFSLLRRKSRPQIILTSKGCSNACSYCSQRRAFGRLQSYPLELIIESYKKALNQHHTVFIFNGDDTGGFGQDIQSSFSELLLRLDQITPEDKKIVWILDNLHPQWLIKYQDTILKLVRKRRVIDIVAPLQAASDRLLKDMRRKYSMEELVPLLEKLRTELPEIELTTHFIIGFPGQEDTDIQAIKTIVDHRFFNHFILLRYFENGEAYSHTLFPKIPAEKVQEQIQDLKKYIQERGFICQMTECE